MNGTHRGSVDYNYATDSRRSSVDSRMQSGFNNLVLNNPASPYESQNASQVSLAASLRRPNGHSQLSPLSARSSLRAQHPAPRIAPPIVANARLAGAPDPTAAKPTQGFPWAFPDSTIQEEPLHYQPNRDSRRESSSESSASHTMSRQNSFAASSVRSSIFSTESALPAGQRRFDDDPNTTHHHSMQHRTVASLQNENSAAGGNYSRTPELRVSHKLAERKRRSEMKDLFEDLNKAVPTNGGAKASKWEILTKGITSRVLSIVLSLTWPLAIEYIKTNQMAERNLHGEMSRLRAEADYARDAHKENELLRNELCLLHERLRQLDPSQPHIYGQYTSQLSSQQNQANGQLARMPLPPINAAVPQPQYTAMAPAAAMQGVEYGAPMRQAYEMRS